MISVRSEDDRAALAKVLDGADLPTARTEFVQAVSAWTATRAKDDVVATMQEAGLPAGPMNRAVDVLADPQLVFRGLYTEMAHPCFRRRSRPRPTRPRSGTSPMHRCAPRRCRVSRRARSPRTSWVCPTTRSIA